MKTQALNPIDETEDIHLDITDELLNNGKMLAYNVGQQVKDENGKKIPVNPKKFPNKAIDIIFPVGEKLIEIFLDTDSKKWDSKLFIEGKKCKLSPEQMGQFFMSGFYAKLEEKLKRLWPLSDELYGNLYEGIANKEMMIGDDFAVTEDDDEKQLPKKTRSGRKIMNFNDGGVNINSSVFTCWPAEGKEFRWSQWKDYKKIRPLCRLRLSYQNDHEYTMSLNPVTELYKHRGFKIADITQQPPVQWLTKAESEDFMKLSLIDKFVRYCSNRIEKYALMDPEEIYEQINNKDKLTIENIQKTQLVIKKTLNEIIKKKQTDDYKWSK